ncbi:AUX/IAA protein [Macleaya cordata]|uniref:Auxin-responsive protein n=1 Tax=Macleaya cordata TaxID=56857 RepID=A0A200QTR9_MACCD|nr:AUX/IAA protein [Macleaya cordata]
MEIAAKYENDLVNLEATELRLGLPGINGSDEKQKLQSRMSNKRTLAERDNEEECGSKSNCSDVSDARDSDRIVAPPAKQQVVGWPPVRSYRKNSFQPKKNNEGEMSGIYVKVSMDGAPYLRKIDLKVYKGYQELLKALENMFKFNIGQYFESQGYNGSDFVPTYEDKDGDWMLVGDVPWEMFISSCKKLRIMRGSEARGLGSGV